MLEGESKRGCRLHTCDVIVVTAAGGLSSGGPLRSHTKTLSIQFKSLIFIKYYSSVRSLKSWGNLKLQLTSPNV